jgi:hypothetical protein
MKISVIAALLAASCVFEVRAQNPVKYPSGIEHVIVVGVDGLSPDGIKKAKTPHLDGMLAAGSVKWNVRTVLTSSSSQNWASMIMGAGPEHHGIISNSWELDDHTLPPIVQEADGRFPTIFSILRKSKPKAEIGVVYHWDGFGRLFQKNAVNYNKRFSTEDSTASDFIQYIKTKKPTLGFVHFDHVDHAGHHDGHGSPTYYASVTKADSLIGEILKGIKQAGIEKNTLVIIWADHGGKGKGHGGATPQEAQIAGIFSGKGIKKGYQVQQQVSTYDLASTIAFALNIEQPFAWIGRPVKPAFESFSEPENLWLGTPTISSPIIHPEGKGFEQSGGLYIDKTATVSMSTAVKNGVIRYTIDGSDPKENSPVYKGPFTVDKTTVVKAIAQDADKNESFITKAYFRVLKSGQRNGLNTSFYQGAGWDKLPVFENLKPSANWKSNEFFMDTDQINKWIKKDNSCFALKYEGFIQIDNPGKYTFWTQSDDGSKLFIDGKKVVDNDGNHGVEEASGSVVLTEGKHAIRVEVYNNDGAYWLDAFYRGPGVAKQLIPADKLFIE